MSIKSFKVQEFQRIAGEPRGVPEFKPFKARGYGRSELTDLQVKQMSRDVALVSVGRVRHTTSGEELERLGEIRFANR